jgi:carbonic anhydrase
MSCSNATSPINIDIKRVYGKCDLKCDYRFKYTNSASVATNRGDYISLTYDSSATSPVVYNSKNYDVKEIRIYTPSLHQYNGKSVEGELIIVHNSNTGARPLLVCIPIKKTNVSSKSANLLTEVINSVANYAPTEGETATINLEKLNLNTFVPSKPFFSYTGTDPYQPCGGKNDFIVFMPLNGGIDISDGTLRQLQSVIRAHQYTITTSDVPFFLNEKGPRNNDISGDDIYIDCQPVGASEETTEVVESTSSSSSSSNMSFNDIMKRPGIQFILAVLFSIVVLYGVNMLIGILSSMSGSGGNSNPFGDFMNKFSSS